MNLLFAADFDFREWPKETGDWAVWLLRGGLRSKGPVNRKTANTTAILPDEGEPQIRRILRFSRER